MGFNQGLRAKAEYRYLVGKDLLDEEVDLFDEKMIRTVEFVPDTNNPSAYHVFTYMDSSFVDGKNLGASLYNLSREELIKQLRTSERQSKREGAIFVTRPSCAAEFFNLHYVASFEGVICIKAPVGLNTTSQVGSKRCGKR